MILVTGLSHEFVCDLLDGVLVEGLVGLDGHLVGGGWGWGGEGFGLRVGGGLWR